MFFERLGAFNLPSAHGRAGKRFRFLEPGLRLLRGGGDKPVGDCKSDALIESLVAAVEPTLRHH